MRKFPAVSVLLLSFFLGPSTLNAAECLPIDAASAAGSLNNVACGRDADATGVGSANAAFGASSSAAGDSSENTAVGAVANAGGTSAGDPSSFSRNTAIGSFAQAWGDDLDDDDSGSFNTAVGTSANASGDESFNTAVGNRADASGDGSRNVAIGDGAQASGAGTSSTAVGAGARATRSNSAAFGANAVATRVNQQSFGTTANTYTMAGIGSAASRAAQAGAVSLVTSDAQGNLATSEFDFGAFQSSINELARRDDQLSEGIAIALSLAQPVILPGQTFALRVGYGNFEGDSAMGLSAAGVVSRNAMGSGTSIVVDAGVGVGASDGTVAGRGGVSFGW